MPGKTVTIDSYGFRSDEPGFRTWKLRPFMVHEIDNVVYLCFDDAPRQPIHRITSDPEDSISTIEWAYGAWADRKSLEYIPINQTREIEV